MAGSSRTMKHLSAGLLAGCATCGCGGKTELEDPIYSLELGGKGWVANGGSGQLGGAFFSGGKAAFGGAQATPAGRGPLGPGGSGGTTTGGRNPGGGGSTLGGRGFGYGGWGGIGGSTYGGRNPLGGQGGATSGGRAQGGRVGMGGIPFTIPAAAGMAICQDAVNVLDTYSITGTTSPYYSNRYAPSCNAFASTTDYAVALYVGTSGKYVLDTYGSLIDTHLAVFSGLCGSTELVCNDDDYNSRESRVVLNLVAGQVITAVIGGESNTVTPVVLNMATPASLVDQVLPSTTPLSWSATTVGHANRFGSRCLGKTASSDYVFLYQAVAGGVYRFQVTSTSFYPSLSIRRDDAAGAELACNLPVKGTPSTLDYALAVGQTVALVVSGYDGTAGDFLFTLDNITSATDTGSCCSAGNPGRIGCIEPGVTQCVCANGNGYHCCSTNWDSTCAQLVTSLGCGSCLLD